MMFSEVEKRDMLLIYLEKDKSPTATLREYRRRYPRGPIPSRYIFGRIYKQFLHSGNLSNKKRERKKTVLIEEMEINILAYFHAHPNKSIRDVVRELPVSIGSVRQTLKKHKFHPYKVKRVHKLNDNDYQRRVEFCRNILQKCEEDNTYLTKIVWTDESSFSTSTGSHRQNTHYWSTHNPRQIQQVKHQGRQSLSVWCGIVGEYVLGPLIYEGQLTGPRYLQFLETEIENFMENLPLNIYRDLIWQQDGAPPHNVQAVSHFLNNKYPDWLGNRGPIQWPANSPDLSPMDFFSGAILSH